MARGEELGDGGGGSVAEEESKYTCTQVKYIAELVESNSWIWKSRNRLWKKVGASHPIDGAPIFLIGTQSFLHYFSWNKEETIDSTWELDRIGWLGISEQHLANLTQNWICLLNISLIKRYALTSESETNDVAKSIL